MILLPEPVYRVVRAVIVTAIALILAVSLWTGMGEFGPFAALLTLILIGLIYLLATQKIEFRISWWRLALIGLILYGFYRLANE
jgi:peptidoglycan/LPS O-acetylase OafA/YrhL